MALNDPSQPDGRRGGRAGSRRRMRVRLDPAQYLADVSGGGGGGGAGDDACYGRMNLVVRRKAKENNFKVVPAPMPSPPHSLQITRPLRPADGAIEGPRPSPLLLYLTVVAAVALLS